MRPRTHFTNAPAERRSGYGTRKSKKFRLFPRQKAIPLPVYRDFVDMLYSMRLPIVGLSIVYISICILAAVKLGELAYAALAAIGVVTMFARVGSLHAYARAAPVKDIDELRQWEWRYAAGNYASAVLLALLNIIALSVHSPILHLITVSLVFSFGAGVVSRTSVRPKICVISLLIATIPTVTALALHAFAPHSDVLHTEMFLIEALLVAMITGLSLQTVAFLYRSALEHHTSRHDLALLAKHDPLTGLANRLLLRERFQAAMEAATRQRRLLAIHFLDLDGFKSVNDRHGHPAGDALLEQVAHRLEAMVRAGDTIARLGGDEFIILQGGLSHEDEAKMLARRIIRQLSAPYTIDDKQLNISVSVGIVTAPVQGAELEYLLACADTALYRAKASGKGRALFCTEDDVAKIDLAA